MAGARQAGLGVRFPLHTSAVKGLVFPNKEYNRAVSPFLVSVAFFHANTCPAASL